MGKIFACKFPVGATVGVKLASRPSSLDLAGRRSALGGWRFTSVNSRKRVGPFEDFQRSGKSANPVVSAKSFGCGALNTLRGKHLTRAVMALGKRRKRRLAMKKRPCVLLCCDAAGQKRGGSARSHNREGRPCDSGARGGRSGPGWGDPCAGIIGQDP